MAPSDPSAAQGPGRPEEQAALSAAEREEYDRLRKAAAVPHRRLRYTAGSVLLVLAFLFA